MTLNKCTVKKIWETFSFWQHFTWWKLLVNTTYNTIWLLITNCNCNSHITHYFWHLLTRLFKMKFLTCKQKRWYNTHTTTTTMAIYYTRLFLELHVHVRSSYKGICSQVLIEILNWYSIDTPSTHWTIKWHLSRQSVDSRLIFYLSNRGLFVCLHSLI